MSKISGSITYRNGINSRQKLDRIDWDSLGMF